MATCNENTNGLARLLVELAQLRFGQGASNLASEAL
jgi:hypothetical protein